MDGSGKGKAIMAEGFKYIGEFKNGKFHGQGSFTYPDGGKYIGEFKDGLETGHGTFTYADGGKYIGEWKGVTTWSWGLHLGRWRKICRRLEGRVHTWTRNIFFRWD